MTRGRPTKVHFADRPSWANRLVAARKRAGLSQMALAKAAGLSQSAIADYEVGRSEPGFRVIERIAEVLQVDRDFLTKATSVSRESIERDLEHRSKMAEGDELSVYQDGEKYDGAFVRTAEKVHSMLTEEMPHTRISMAAVISMSRIAWRMAMMMSGGQPTDEVIAAVVSLLRTAQRTFARFPDATGDMVINEDDDMDETGIDRSDKPD
ncbi:helix-turn-helix domain-containing protein [Pseudoroseomonas wenyumeiae]|uniref:Helix-turn-helix domain-containing protein n=1 Tax=Teichococcus wenyumeiae TaxID=2478470 RepID=A0A3A9JHM5_9PROT|nr:helix-turn-helix transcriptional regulator [Pseudoroseomonas wenyumeiae]RKK04015.1 XRE family transcriptional regulator [Pseudoroseomonas wenyumeiae]RMI19413.1 helix-turn-helix domain-containing protein [Pseudoroseomonas wenyumeiae]RMI20276.1 helix-turn-helix domain-containing protein [Pseudoroseomonas wenyumeiae]